jgi:hypothetical protein
VSPVQRIQTPDQVSPEPDVSPAIDPAGAGSRRFVIVEGYELERHLCRVNRAMCSEQEMSESALVPIEEDEELGP